MSRGLVIGLLVTLVVVAGGGAFFYEKYSSAKAEETKSTMQKECLDRARNYDEKFRERRAEDSVASKVVVGDGRFKYVESSFLVPDAICVYENNWTEFFLTVSSPKANVHHRIINVDTHEELAATDWQRNFVSGEWKDKAENLDVDKTAKFVNAEREYFGNSLILPDDSITTDTSTSSTP